MDKSVEILSYLVENGKIDINSTLQDIRMDRRAKMLAEHPHKIYESNGKWYTYINKEGSDKRVLVKRKSKEDIEGYVISLIEEKHKLTFKQRFDIWVDRQRMCGRSPNTIYKYKKDYERFFEGYPIEDMNIEYITEDVLVEHIRTVLAEKKIPYRALKNIWGYVEGTFQKAIKDKVISKDENPCDYVDIPMLRQYCTEVKEKTASERTLSDAEKQMLVNNLKIETQNVNWLSNWGVELALYTGMRVGEISALSWDDIDFENGMMTIRRSEKLNKETRERYISDTKNSKIRTFPITNEIRKLLMKVKNYEISNGWYGEYVFQDSEGRVNAQKIGCCARHKSENLPSGTKCIHAIRRTVNSNMKMNGINTAVASQLLGHSERVNEANYTYDVIDKAEKMRIVALATQIGMQSLHTSEKRM